jgi:hypothetical protein
VLFCAASLPALARGPVLWADQILARVNAAVARDTASPDEFRKPGDADDTNSIQAALDTGKSVVLRAKREYVVSRPLRMHSAQRLAGAGPETVLKARNGWMHPAGAERNTFSLITNAGYLETTPHDRSLMVENLSIDASAIGRANGAFHGIGFRQARDVVVRNVHCHRIGDCTAFEATNGTVVVDSDATEVTNVGFDHWEGPVNAVVARVRIEALETGTGVMFTAAAGRWTTHRNRDGHNLIASDVTVTGPMLAGIVANVLTPGGGLSNVTIEDSTVDPASHLNASGIMLSGNITASTVRNVIIENIRGGIPIGIRPNDGQRPQNITVHNMHISNVFLGTRNPAVVVALGRGHTLSGIVITGGSYRYGVWIDDPSTHVVGDIRAGSQGRVLFKRSDADR